MNSEQIKYFLGMTKYLNYSETARQLYVSQPTVSKQIAALEDTLNVKLFDVKNSTITLTPEGHLYKECFEEMYSVFDSYNSMVDQMHNDKPNILHIAFLEGIDISEYAAPIIDLLSASHPEVIVKLDFASHTEINEGLQNKKIDVGITLLDEIIAHNNLEYAFLAKMKHGIAFHESLNLINDDKLDLEKMKKEKFYITLDGSLGAKNYIISLKQYFGLDDANFVYVPNIETQILNVEMGLGVSALSYTPRIQNNSELCFIPIDFFNMRIAAAWNKNNRSLAKKYFTKAARSYSKTRKNIK